MDKEDDPLWDEPRPALLGYCFYKLEPLAYLMNNPDICTIVSYKGTEVGFLNLDILPHDGTGKEFDEVLEPKDLISQVLHFKVCIKDAIQLPVNFCREVHVEYTLFSDGLTYRTEKSELSSQDVSFDTCFEHKLSYVTKEDVEYMLREDVKLFKLSVLALFKSICNRRSRKEGKS